MKTADNFRCGEGDKRCNCEKPPECRYIAVYREIHQTVYPGWEYQPLFDYLSDAHDLSLTKDEMDEILSAAAKVMDRQIAALSVQNAINTPIIGEIKL